MPGTDKKDCNNFNCSGLACVIFLFSHYWQVVVTLASLCKQCARAQLPQMLSFISIYSSGTRQSFRLRPRPEFKGVD